MDITLGHDEELIWFWWPWPIFQGQCKTQTTRKQWSVYVNIQITAERYRSCPINLSLDINHLWYKIYCKTKFYFFWKKWWNSIILPSCFSYGSGLKISDRHRCCYSASTYLKVQQQSFFTTAWFSRILKIQDCCPLLLTWDPLSFWVTLDKDQRMTLNSGTCISSCSHLIYYIYQLLYHF